MDTGEHPKNYYVHAYSCTLLCTVMLYLLMFAVKENNPLKLSKSICCLKLPRHV